MAVSCEAALRMLRERARQFVSNAMAACVASANDSLFELTKAAPDAATQTRYLDAMRLWHGARRSLADALLTSVDSAFTALGERIPAPPAVVPGASLGLASDEDLDELIAINAMVAETMALMDAVLGRLLGRVEALCGAILAPHEFPLTPHFMLTRLAREMDHLGLAPQARLAILRACHATQSRTLPGVVAQADELLEQLGVAPRRDPLAPALVGGRADAVAMPAGAASAPGSSGAASGEGVRPDPDRPAPEAACSALLDGLRRLVPVRGGRRQSIRTRLEGALARMGRSLADLDPEDLHRVQLVDALFDEMANETWMPAALGELLAAADIAVVALASADPTFLTKPLHPARRLLQEIIVAATDFLHMENYADQELFRRAGEAIDRLTELRADPERLAALLIEFVSLVEREREQGERRAAPALRDASSRERTDAAHARVARILNDRVTGRGYPLALIDMLERGWCRVLFDAWLKHGEQSSQWRGAVHLLDQLVGVMGDVEPDQELVARLLEALAAHLDAIALDPFDARRLLDSLRLCLCADAIPRVTPGPVTPSPAPPSLVLTPGEARELDDPRLLVVANRLELALPGHPARVAHEGAADLDEFDLGLVDALRPGSWVEFRDAAGDARRAQLLGVVQPADTHVFGDPDGTVFRQLPRLRLALALREGSALVLDHAPLFDRALARASRRVAAGCE
ncbi:MAG: DUF1631 family protein [Porticoccaceae bacterium]